MSFAFFLHGESTVCASIDVRQHPPLHCLRHMHLSVASQLLQNGGVHGILAEMMMIMTMMMVKFLIYAGPVPT